jgi:hypothetical protein
MIRAWADLIGAEMNLSTPQVRQALVATCAAFGGVALLPACGGSGSSSSYKLDPTTACLTTKGLEKPYIVHAPDRLRSRSGLVGAVEGNLGRYSVGVLFYDSEKLAERDFKRIRSNEALALRSTPAPSRATVKRSLESRNYVLGNALISWSRGSFSEPVPTSLRDTLAGCLRNATGG